MQTIKVIKEIEITDRKPKNNITWTRKAARAVVINDKNKIPLLSVTKFNYHKLPGGGIEKNEKIVDGLRREVMEEVGCEIQNIKEIGKIIEYRNKLNKKQISYNYLAYTQGPIKKPTFTNKEIRNQFSLKWAPIEQAISIMKNSKPSNYEGKFIQKRDLEILIKCEKLLTNLGKT
jgi:8-oxo-dGTP diphosphatase